MFASVASTPLRWDGELTPAVVAMLAALCGLWALARRAPLHAILLAGPTALGAAASFVGLYPMSDRLAFFAAPLMILVSAKCVAGILSLAASRGGPRGVTVTTVVAGAALALWIGSDAWRMVRDPGALEPTRGLFEKIRADAKSAGTPVYVFSRAAPAWLYATSDWSAPANPRHAFYRRSTGDVNHVAHENFSRPAPVSSGAGDSLAVPGALPAELIGLATGVRYRVAGAMSRDGVAPGWAEEEARRILAVANPDVWIVASHFFEGTPRDELRPLIAALRAAGAVVAEEIRGGRDALALRIVEPPPPQVPTRR
jgi:hypothetical protein